MEDNDDRQSYQHGVPPADHCPTGLKNKSQKYKPYQACTDFPRKMYEAALGFLGSETAVILSVIMTSYRSRYNSIAHAHHCSAEEINHLYSTYLVDYKMPLHELLKRYLIRTGALTQDQANCMAFDDLADNGEALTNFSKHVSKAGYIDYRGKMEMLFMVNMDPHDGKRHVMLAQNACIKRFVQLMNSIGDAISQWDREFKAVSGKMPAHSKEKFQIS